MAKAEHTIQVKDKLEITIGKNVKLNAVLKEGDGALSYAVANSKVAKVTKSGNVIAKAVGKTTITVTAAETDKYAKQECQVVVRVIPKAVPVKSLSCNKHGKLTIKWAKVKQSKKIDGFIVAFAKGDKTFKNAKVKKIKKATCSKTVIKNLKKQKYYVRIRTFKIVDGEFFFSNWSKAKAIKIKK